jgi:hypothetical protein
MPHFITASHQTLPAHLKLRSLGRKGSKDLHKERFTDGSADVEKSISFVPVFLGKFLFTWW